MAKLEINFSELFQNALKRYVSASTRWGKDIEEKSDDLGWGKWDCIEKITKISEEEKISYGEYENRAEKVIRIQYITSHGRQDHLVVEGSLVALLNEMVFCV